MPPKRKYAEVLSGDAQHRVVISIDLGTARTGYAYCFIDNPDVIEAKPPGRGGDSEKTLTNLLLHEDGSFCSFGHEARTTYYEDAGKGLSNKLFFQNFKMELAGEPADLMTKKIKALNGKEHSLKSVFVHTLRYVREEALKEVSRAVPDGITRNQVHWVLTIPAIWRDSAKSFMRTCAVEAGLISQRDSQSLVLALEPEAACLSTEKAGNFLAAGDKFMVLDCGGGTVDITMHRVRSKAPFRLEEIAVADGGAWGSTYIDKNFELFIEQLITTPHWKVFCETPFYVELMESWEKVKLNFRVDDTASRPINLSLISEVLGDKVTFKERIDLHNASHKKDLTLRGRTILLIPPALIREFHEVVVKKTVQCVLGLCQAHLPKYVFMVGGFSESDHLQHQLKGMLTTPTRKVIVPMRPGLAVVKGAVLFGVSRDAFASRMLRYTYGTSTNIQFNAANKIHTGLSPETYRTYMQNGSPVVYVTGMFQLFAAVGASIPVDHKVAHEFLPATDGQSNVTFKLYATQKESAIFVTEAGMQGRGSVTIPIDRKRRVDENAVTCEFCFGDTEIVVTVVNEDGAKETHVIDFNV